MKLITDVYISGLLADLCYVEGLAGMASDELTLAITPRMTKPLAEFITNNFSVLHQTPENSSGFSCTVWCGNSGTDYSRQMFISMRGTELGYLDLAADADLATSGLTRSDYRYGQLVDARDKPFRRVQQKPVALVALSLRVPTFIGAYLCSRAGKVVLFSSRAVSRARPAPTSLLSGGGDVNRKLDPSRSSAFPFKLSIIYTPVETTSSFERASILDLPCFALCRS